MNVSCNGTELLLKGLLFELHLESVVLLNQFDLIHPFANVVFYVLGP